MNTLEPDFAPVHKLAARTVPGLAGTETFLAERAAPSHAAERDSIGNLPHIAGLLADQAVNAMADLGLATAAPHHFIANSHATIRHSVIKGLHNLRSRLYTHELARS